MFFLLGRSAAVSVSFVTKKLHKKSYGSFFSSLNDFDVMMRYVAEEPCHKTFTNSVAVVFNTPCGRNRAGAVLEPHQS